MASIRNQGSWEISKLPQSLVSEVLMELALISRSAMVQYTFYQDRLTGKLSMLFTEQKTVMTPESNSLWWRGLWEGGCMEVATAHFFASTSMRSQLLISQSFTHPGRTQSFASGVSQFRLTNRGNYHFKPNCSPPDFLPVPPLSGPSCLGTI